ncbi:non-ribosomal peptide synthetase [Abyssisolibacter fermentans]|uniref:non-ribosomal peptide synthetase n=1 Tax=Abyssisolibacter fermentans TaxID=1766203 RepID=UPI00082EBADA|nr:non-ribosomal peptide synthetase [Abyssisolibacter fermentans]
MEDFTKSEVPKTKIMYWEKKFKEIKNKLELPTDYARQPNIVSENSVLSMVIKDDLAKSIRNLCLELNEEPFILLLTVFRILLYRYTGQEDIAFGYSMINMKTEEYDDNDAIILKSKLHANLTFEELLHKISQEYKECSENLDMPFKKIKDTLQLHNDLIQAMFGFFEGSKNIRYIFNKIDKDFPNLEIKIIVKEEIKNDEITMICEYNNSLFEETTIHRMMKHYINLLKGVIRDKKQKISTIKLLSDQERNKLIHEWNDTNIVYSNVKPLHNIFEEQVLKTPQQTAVICGKDKISYSELNIKSNKLAHCLMSLGVKPDVPVGVCIERSVDMIVALMGILKAGGAYLPMEVNAPVIRKEQIFNDAHALVCISQKHLLNKLPKKDNTIYVYIDEGLSDDYPSSSPEIELSAKNLISIYYTSGSTGKPKGVCSTHEGWVNRMMWMQQQYKLETGETVLQKTTLTFDDSAVEIFWPLMVGGRIAMLEPELHKDPQAILDAVIKYDVVVLHFVPSMLVLFLDAVNEDNSKKLQYLKHTISSGEALRPELVRTFMEKFKNVSLNNQWGATEVSIDSTHYVCRDCDTNENAPVSIGKPISNNAVYILDEYLNPVPIGVAGDLYLGGIGLARGYLNRPELTEKVFVANPFKQGTLMYNTGDKGRYLPNGLIQFLGRKDHQVKIRGQRVELGEIESALASHNLIKDCAVVANKHSEGYRLSAYYVTTDEDVKEKLSVESLRQYMSELLPEYMVPGRFIGMDKLPKTSSGKIDRKKLIDPKEDRPNLEEEYVAALTNIEKVIVDIWKETMNISKIGVNDNFFDLGGHSLDGTRIMSRVNKQFGIKIPLRKLFQTLTVKKLSVEVDKTLEKNNNNISNSLMNKSIPMSSELKIYTLSNAQKRYYFKYQFAPENACGVAFAAAIEGDLNKEVFMQALNKLVDRHDIIRTTFKEIDGIPYQVIRNELEIPCHYYDLTDLDEKKQKEIIADKIDTEKNTPFDFVNGPLFKFYLYKFNEQKHIFIHSVHPISYDSWSVKVLTNDLSELYKVCSNKGKIKNLNQTLQYIDFTAWQEKILNSGEINEQKEYWREKLSDIKDQAKLPSDELDYYEPMIIRRPVINKELTSKLKEFSSYHRTTLHLTLLAGFKTWMALVTGKNDIVICSPASGRTHPQLEGILGLMVNPVAIRTKFYGNPNCLQILENIKQTALQAYANQDYPIDLVFQDLNVSHGLYSVVFVGQNAHDSVVKLDNELYLKYYDKENQTDINKRNQNKNRLSDDPQGRMDLHIEMFEETDVIRFRVMYNPMKFKAETVDQFFKQYEFVLNQFVENSNLRLSQIKLQDFDEIDELFM